MSSFESAGRLPRGDAGAMGRFVSAVNSLLSRVPHDFLAALTRFSVAAVFWKSGQTKVENFAIDIVEGKFSIGAPRFAEATVDLFREEYRLPLLPPELAALAAAVAEHVFPALILIGLATRMSAFALLVMTLVIQVLVYPGAYATHGVWAASLLYLMKEGPGRLSLDHVIAKRRGA